MSNTGQQQFLRAVSLVVGSSKTGSGIDLSQLRFTFEVRAQDVETPNNCTIKVYNLSDDTRRQILQEFDTVFLQAGYQGNFGLIFTGNIKQFKRGKENNTDTFLQIMAADADENYNFSTIAQSFPAGTTQEQILAAMAGTLDLSIDRTANATLTGGVLPRGKVLFGMTRNYMREIARTNNARFSIQNGVVTLVPLDSYLPGEAVVLTSATGVIGIPVATDNGVEVMCLLNPKIKVGFTVKLDNREITATIVRDQFFPQYAAAPTMVANTENDGLYRVLVVEHTGDTRGDEWYSHLTCIHVDISSNEVQPF